MTKRLDPDSEPDDEDDGHPADNVRAYWAAWRRIHRPARSPVAKPQEET